MVNKVLKLGAEWCAPCRALSEMLKQVTDVPIEELDVDENEEICEKYKIRNIPVLLFLNEKDEELGRTVGNISLETFYNKIKELNEK